MNIVHKTIDQPGCSLVCEGAERSYIAPDPPEDASARVSSSLLRPPPTINTLLTVADVATGAIVPGPQGAFKPSAGAVKATTGEPGR